MHLSEKGFLEKPIHLDLVYRFANESYTFCLNRKNKDYKEKSWLFLGPSSNPSSLTQANTMAILGTLLGGVLVKVLRVPEPKNQLLFT